MLIKCSMPEFAFVKEIIFYFKDVYLWVQKWNIASRDGHTRAYVLELGDSIVFYDSCEAKRLAGPFSASSGPNGQRKETARIEVQG